jgi:hypothetical protein
VGRVLQKMRWQSERTKSARGWAVNVAELHRWTRAYGVEWPEELGATQGAPHLGSVTSVTGVTSVTAPGTNGANGGNSASLSPQQIDFEWGEI